MFLSVELFAQESSFCSFDSVAFWCYLYGTGSARAPTVIFLASFVAFRQVYLYVTGLIFTPELVAALSDSAWTRFLLRFSLIENELDLAFFPMALAFPMGWMTASLLLIICDRRSRLFRAKMEPKAAVRICIQISPNFCQVRGCIVHSVFCA